MPRQHDHIGAETLRRMSAVSRYNDWIIERILPWTGDTVLEAGSGIGNISRYFLDRKRLILSDVREDYIERLRETFKDYPNVTCELFDMEGAGSHLQGKGIDTVIALNVLEHIKDDIHALREIHGILEPGGRIILQLPAHTLLYGTLDVNLDHYRRYTKKSIAKAFRESGFVPKRMFRMNIPGALGWFLYSRILQREILPEGPLGLFNKLTPLFMAFERIVPPPLGLSIIAVGEKPTDHRG